MKENQIKIINKSSNPLPFYQTEGSAGMDLYANNEESVILKPMDRALIPTGIHIQLNKGQTGLVCSRSGLAYKHGIQVLNAPGVLDWDFSGDIGVILQNLSDEDFIINKGDRIAQLVIIKYEKPELILVDTLDETERGDAGFGSTGR